MGSSTITDADLELWQEDERFGREVALAELQERQHRLIIEVRRLRGVIARLRDELRARERVA